MGLHWSQVLLVLGAVAFVLLVLGLLAATILRSACAQHMDRRRARRLLPPPPPSD
jgi:hypothetical protein